MFFFKFLQIIEIVWLSIYLFFYNIQFTILEKKKLEIDIYLSVTRFFILLPKSEYPRWIGGLFCTCCSSNDLVIGEFGSEYCLSTKQGLGYTKN